MSEWADALNEKYRYIFISGGRASSKSHEVAAYLAERSISEVDLNVLCLREIQKSIKYSSKSLIEQKLKSFGVYNYYTSIQAEIKKDLDDGIFLFQGMSDITADSAKSLEGFKIAWFEEAQNMSLKSLKTLRPTIRMDDSQIIFTWNPNQPTDPIDQFANEMKLDPRCLHIHVNYDQNAFLPDTIKTEIEADRKNFPDDFDHIWLGGYETRSDIRVFQNWTVEECEPEYGDILYYGSDFGFAQDPTTLLRAWVREDEKRIYVDYQIDGIGIETDHLPEFYKQVPDSDKYAIRADSARPETISYLNRHGYRVIPSIKGKGSVEDGINWLRGHEIVIHPRCKLLEKELRLYSYKVDKGGNILPKVDDKASLDHCFVGDTLVTTINGKIPIKDIKIGDLVLTRKGFKPVLKVFNNGEKEVKTYKFANGSSLTCTDTHNIITKAGKVNIKDLSDSDVIYYEVEKWKFIEAGNQKFAYLKAKNIEDTLNLKDEMIGFILKKAKVIKKQNIFTGKFIKNIMEIFQKVFMFIIKTTIHLTTSLITWLLLVVLNIYQNTRLILQKTIKNLFLKISINKDRLRQNGINQKKVGNGIKNNTKITKINYMRKLQEIAPFVARNTRRLERTQRNHFVKMHVNQHTAVKAVLMTLKKIANGVIIFSRAINIARCKHAQGRVQCVYDIMVQDEHEYFANGILVSNCIDGLRYALEDIIRDNKGGDIIII